MTSPRGSAPAHLRTLPERAALPLERALPEHDESAERLSVLADLGSAARTWSCVGSLLAFVQRTLSPSSSRAGRTRVRGRGADRPARPAAAPRGRRLRPGRRGHRHRRVRASWRADRRLAARRGGAGAHRALRRRGRVHPQLRPDDPGVAPPPDRDRTSCRPRSSCPPTGWDGVADAAPDLDLRPAARGRGAAGAGRRRRGRRDVGRAPHRRARPRTTSATSAHLVLTDLDELRRSRATSTGRRPIASPASSRPASSAASWPRALRRRRHPRRARRARRRAARRAAAAPMPATRAAPPLPGRADRAGAWLIELGR